MVFHLCTISYSLLGRYWKHVYTAEKPSLLDWDSISEVYFCLHFYPMQIRKSVYQCWISSVKRPPASRRMLDITVISNLISEPAKFKEINIAHVNKTLTVQCLLIFIAYRREVRLPRKKNTLWSITFISSWEICNTPDLYHYSILVWGCVRLRPPVTLRCQQSATG